VNLSGPLSILIVVGVLLLPGSPNAGSMHDRLWRHRNLGKAYYENPMTQLQAVDEFKQALALAPASARDRVNYGLALLRAGSTKEAIVELQKAQKQDPTIPHTWFNLGIAYKGSLDYGQAIQQFEGMLKLVPNEPVTHYNLGIAYRATGKPELALPHFAAAAKLNPNFAAPHFQLYNAYREAGRKEEAARELEQFNEIKKRKSGAAVPEDPDWSYYSEIYDAVEVDGETDRGPSSPEFKFLPRQVASGADPASAGMAVLDHDGDGRPDLIVWSENGVLLLKNGVTPVAGSGLENLKGVVSIAPGDFNNDGLPDLAVLTHAGAALYVNHGGRFELSAQKLPAGSYNKAVWIDYDHDYDLDLILLGDKSVLLRNEGTAGFSDQTAQFPFTAGRAIDGAVFDLAPDSDEADLAVLYSDGSTIVYHDGLLGKYDARAPIPGTAPGKSIQAFDINNDGWTDLVLATGNGSRLLINNHGNISPAKEALPGKGPFVIADLGNRGLADLVMAGAVYRNLGSARFGATHVDSLAKSVAMVQADFDGDGHPDIAGVEEDGSISLFRNVTPSTNNFLAVGLEGIKNLKQAYGAVIEVKAGAWYQKRTYSGIPQLFGLGAYSEVDTIRITWPNGLVQNETKQVVGKHLAFKEKARLSGSCPMIFAWDGAHFQFVTDVLGVAPLGASNGNGQYFPVNHKEYIQIPPSALRPHGDHFELRITEELREVSYLDQVQLVAIDHEAGEELYTSDKFTGPPFPDFHLYSVRNRIYPASAIDQEGRNVLPRLLRHDEQYADSFSCNAAGVAEPHSLTLDFGDAARANQAFLVLRGWVDWADGSTFVGAAQQGNSTIVFPYLQVEDAKGQWRTVVPDMGMPSGKPKAIVVDLAGKFLTRSRKVRIVTSLCVFWDQIFLAEQANTSSVKMTSSAPSSADLEYRGFSRMSPGSTRSQPEQFRYDAWTPVSMWNPVPGLYTRYGDVQPLLLQADDQMVIMGSGDELRLRFDSRHLPPPAPGWKRDYLLFVDGWAKDADANTAFSGSVTPLPFHAMSSYPYPAGEHYPDDPAHRAYQDQYNTRPPYQDLGSLREQGSAAHSPAPRVP
jgi:tetratricopeptide (TPR) repeat protein